jgi:hypothetical protein
VAAIRAPLHGAHRLRDRQIHHPLADVVARQRERIVGLLAAPGRGLGRGGRRLQLLEDVVEQPLIEGEFGAQRLGGDVGGDLGTTPMEIVLY